MTYFHNGAEASTSSSTVRKGECRETGERPSSYVIISPVIALPLLIIGSQDLRCFFVFAPTPLHSISAQPTLHGSEDEAARAGGEADDPSGLQKAGAGGSGGSGQVTGCTGAGIHCQGVTASV